MRIENFKRAINEYDENELERLFFKSKIEDKKILVQLLEENNMKLALEIEANKNKLKYANTGLELINDKVNEMIKTMTE